MKNILLAMITCLSFCGYIVANAQDADTDLKKAEVNMAKLKKAEADKIITINQYRTHLTSVVRKNSKDTKACKKEIKPKKGRMLIVWEMDEKGKARDFTRGEDIIQNEALFHCMVKKIEKWKFKAPPNDRPLDFKHLFVF